MLQTSQTMQPLEKPILRSERCILRPYTLADGDAVWPVASHPLVYKTTYTIPKDYPRSHVDWWLNSVEENWQQGISYEFGIFSQRDGTYIGNVALLRIVREHLCASIAYFIDPDQWGKGYATEATRCLCRYAFETLGMHRISGECYSVNIASRKTMEKAGFRYEGTRIQEKRKDGVYYDVDLFGLLCSSVYDTSRFDL